jgi:monovalent cation/proton antiporter MnhG/PhaG subunit
MSLVLNLFSVAAISVGSVFFLAGTLGLLRFPDPLSRLHALTKADNVGLGLIVLGLLPLANGVLGGLKLVVVWVLVQLSGATVGQLIALPDPSPTLAPQAIDNIAATGLGNPVTAVLIAYRAFDTMLEKCVLVLAVVGVWSLASDRYWGGAPGMTQAAGRNGTLTFFAQLLPPLGILIGIRIFWVGADEPGGAFQGGAILAAMWMIIIMARLGEAPAIGARWMRFALASGPIVFVGVGVLGFAAAGGFLAYPVGFAKPVIIFVEIFMTLSIAATLPMLVAGPPIRAPQL